MSSFKMLEARTLRNESKGGLIQLVSRGSSATAYALALLSQNPQALALWISDEGLLYPALLPLWNIPLQSIVLIQAKSHSDVWKTGLEAVRSGLFDFVLLRPSRPCHAHFLRKLQIQAEHTQRNVFLLCQSQLPHWVLKNRLEVSSHIYENPLFPKPFSLHSAGRSLLCAYTKSLAC
ncbi:MAG: hypothetical protein HY537_08730 [Deltaproteobacteria bacterium]|nr:hypothetical protein [Deltaproteobacteria bacterium]